MFTHEYVGTDAGNEGFIFDENEFERTIARPTIEALGEEWAEVMDIDYRDDAGNRAYVTLDESRCEDILEALLEGRRTVLLPYTRDGMYRDPQLNHCYGMFRFLWRGGAPTRDEISTIAARPYAYSGFPGFRGLAFMRDVTA